MKVTIEITGSNVTVDSPYNPNFVAGAKRLAGRWSKPNWVFPKAQEARVRALCVEVYGTDGSETHNADTRVRLLIRPGSSSNMALRVGPLQICRAFDRDSGAALAPGVVLLGEITSGGSRKNPRAAWSYLIVEAEVPAGAVPLISEDAAVLSWEVVPAGETAEQAERAAEALRAALKTHFHVRSIHGHVMAAEQLGYRVETEWLRAAQWLAAQEGEDAAQLDATAYAMYRALRDIIDEEAKEAAWARACAMPVAQLQAMVAGRSTWTLEPYSYYGTDIRELCQRRVDAAGGEAVIRAHKLRASLDALVAEYGIEAVTATLNTKEAV